MRTFRIPVSWEMFATVEIEAESIEKALQIFDETESDMGLPEDGDYIDSSFKRQSNSDCIEFNEVFDAFRNHD